MSSVIYGIVMVDIFSSRLISGVNVIIMMLLFSVICDNVNSGLLFVSWFYMNIIVVYGVVVSRISLVI